MPGMCWIACRQPIGLHHSQSAVPPDKTSYNQNLGFASVSHEVVSVEGSPRRMEAPEPPPAYDSVSSTGRPPARRPDAVTLTSRSPSTGGYDDGLRRIADSEGAPVMFIAGSASFTSDGSIASSVVATVDDDNRSKVVSV